MDRPLGETPLVDKTNKCAKGHTIRLFCYEEKGHAVFSAGAQERLAVIDDKPYSPTDLDYRDEGDKRLFFRANRTGQQKKPLFTATWREQARK